MSTPHNSANVGDIAERVLLPGDPLRAKFIAENFLENAVCYNNVRGMLGYTGTYKGKRVSVQGTGMGMPSFGIYVHELICEYGCKRLIRIGSCGSMSPDYNLLDIIIAQAAGTDSAIPSRIFGQGITFPPVADFKLLREAVENSERLGIKANVATVFSSDLFYSGDSYLMKKIGDFGIPCVEMEAAQLFLLGAKYKVQTLGILTVSDLMYGSGADLSAEERQNSFREMMRLALETI